MRVLFKKVSVAMMIAGLLSGILAVPSQDVQAASKNHIKKLGLRWDLKKSKTVVYDSVFAGIGKIKKAGTFKITKYKVSNARKKGYKKLALTYVQKYTVSLTDTKIHKAANSSYCRKTGSTGGGRYFAIVDYNTGMSLEEKNKLNVKVTSSTKLLKTRKFKDKDGCYMECDNTRVTLTITYPEDYDGLCIGLGGYNQLSNSKADNSFWRGKKEFGKTSYYKKGKKNSHWMRVRASKKNASTATSSSKPTTTPALTVTASPSGVH